MQNYRDELSREQMFKPRLYTFPDFSKSSTVFDYDDLQQEDALMVVCVRAETDTDKDRVYIWKGHEFEADNGMLTEDEFVERVILEYWGQKGGNIERVEEEPGEESDDFLNYFD